MQPSEIQSAIKKIPALSKQTFAVNLFVLTQSKITTDELKAAQELLTQICQELKIEIDLSSAPYAPSFDEQLDIVIAEKVPVLSFTFGIPNQEQISRLKKNNICLIGTATNLSEALLLEENEIDLIVAQGIEAGGHRGSFLNDKPCEIGLMALIPQLVDKLKTPVIAAGGIVASMVLGAKAVQMGTAFLTYTENEIAPKYKERLLTASCDQTVLTRSFSGKLARGIKNKFIEKMQNHQNRVLPYPIQHVLTKKIRSIATKNNNTELMSL